MNLYKKMVISFVLATLVLTSTSISATASENSNQISDGDISPQADIVHVGKPIANKGSISNKRLGDIIDKRNSDVKMLEILTWLSGVIDLPGATVDSLALTLSNDSGLTSMEKAYARGENMYWVELYADGTPNNLSKEARVFYSKTPITIKE